MLLISDALLSHGDRLLSFTLTQNIGAGVNSYFRNGNIDEFPPGIAWVNGWGDITGDFPFQKSHYLYIGTGYFAEGQCVMQYMIDAFSGGGSAVRYRESRSKPWTAWKKSKETAEFDISSYSWSSGRNIITRIGDMVYLNIGIIGVTHAASEGIFEIPDDFSPSSYTSVLMGYKQNNTGDFYVGVADIYNGYLRTSINLTNAFVLINASWRV